MSFLYIFGELSVKHSFAKVHDLHFHMDFRMLVEVPKLEHNFTKRTKTHKSSLKIEAVNAQTAWQLSKISL